MLLINRKDMLIVAGNALGFLRGSGDVPPFPVDLSDFCRSFREESLTTIKIYLSYDVLFVTTSSKQTVFLVFGPQFVTRSYSGGKIE